MTEFVEDNLSQNIIKYYDIKALGERTEYNYYRSRTKPEHFADFQEYSKIRSVYTFDEICNDEPIKIGLIYVDTNQFAWTKQKFPSSKLTKSVKNCNDLWNENVNQHINEHIIEQTNEQTNEQPHPKFIIIPSEFHLTHNYGFSSFYDCDNIFLSLDLIKQYEEKYLNEHNNTIIKYSDYVGKLNKDDNNLYRFFCLANYEGDDDDYGVKYHESAESFIQSKIEGIYNSMRGNQRSNNYLTMTLKINSITKSVEHNSGIDFEGIICSYHYKDDTKKLNKEFEVGEKIIISTDIFSKLSEKNPTYINITHSDIYFTDTTFWYYLIREDIYKKCFLNWIWDYYH